MSDASGLAPAEKSKEPSIDRVLRAAKVSAPPSIGRAGMAVPAVSCEIADEARAGGDVDLRIARPGRLRCNWNSTVCDERVPVMTLAKLPVT